LEQTLAIVQRNKILHASAFLLERMGDVESAFKLLHDDLQERVSKLCREFQELPDESDLSEEVEDNLVGCGKALQEVLRLCLRNSQRLEKEDREALWFPLLETVMAPQRSIKVFFLKQKKIKINSFINNKIILFYKISDMYFPFDVT
ncbi:MAG: hypothetical protein AAFY76_21425, partial [Cyanobacteria bacterium J06649_11]